MMSNTERNKKTDNNRSVYTVLMSFRTRTDSSAELIISVLHIQN